MVEILEGATNFKALPRERRGIKKIPLKRVADFSSSKRR